MTTIHCSHHWIIETPKGPVSNGRCKLCGEEKEFSNSVETRGGWTPSTQTTQTPGTKLTIISGPLRGWRCIHQADVLHKSLDSPVPVPAFRVHLVTEDGEPDRSVVLGCHSVKVGW